MKKIIIANWKCNPMSVKGAVKMAGELNKGLSKQQKLDVVLCPSFLHIADVKKVLKGSLKLGAQSCFWQDSGPFTGEVSSKMLLDAGVKYVILGHSERRVLFGETNEMVNKKVVSALKFGITPIVCVGETQEERNSGKTFQILEKEIKESLSGLTAKDVGNIIIAYEPLWAISNGKNYSESIACSGDDILTVALYVKKLFSGIYGKKIGDSAKFVYGGSVNKENAKEYLDNDAVSGLLVGGASLNTKEFISIVKSI